MKHTLKILLSALFVTIVGGCGSTGNYGVLHDSSYSDLFEVDEAVPSASRLSADSLDEGNKLDSTRVLTWRPAMQAVNNSVMKVGEQEDLKPKAVDVSVQIDGFRARVVVDSFYHNPHNANLEGAFKYRLPNGARPYFFAFGETFAQTVDFQGDTSERVRGDRVTNFGDLNPEQLMLARNDKWKAPKQAVMVTRAKAALAYTTIVARQVDPALLEWSGSGVFSAKVFPLQPNKLHRVVIGYDVDLMNVGNDLVFDLPINNSITEKRVRVNVVTAKQESVAFHEVVADKVQDASIARGSDNEGRTSYQKTFGGSELGGVRVVISQASSSVLTGRDKASSYFALRSHINLPEFQIDAQRRALFALDTSWSAAPEKFQQWVDLLLATLANNEQNIREFAVMTFSVDHHWWQRKFVDNTQANRQALVDYLNQTVLEGATDLNQALLNAGQPTWLSSEGETKNDFDLFLYSDGAVTWGESEAYLLSESLKKSFAGRLLAYRFGLQGENIELLHHLTREFSGATYQLAANDDISALSIAHNSMAWEIESVALSGADDILIEGRPSVIYPGQQLKIAGRIASAINGPLRIKVSLAGREQTIELPTDNTVESDLTARVYGQISVNQLESLGDLERVVAEAYALHFLVPGSISSLLMLETESDYREQGIKPEDHAFVVASETVTATMQKLATDFKITLTNQKKRFIKQLERLGKIQNINFVLPTAVTVLLDDMPDSVFSVESLGIKTSRLQKRDVSENYLEIIGKNSDVYDVVDAEAKERFETLAGADALKVMSSLVEIAPSDPVVLREVAFAAEGWDMYGAAYKLHEKVAKVRPYEPQTYNDLAKLADRLGNADLALLYYEVGLASDWAGRFGDFHLIHKIDYLNFLKKMEKNSLDFHSSLYAKLKAQSLREELDFEASKVIVSISWNTDRTDVDLHVVEPSGERCSYKNTRTRSGGYITRDVTTGYGPEMYVNKKGPRGRYKVYAKYFSSDRNSLGLKTKVRVRIVKHWGSERQSEQSIVVALNDSKQMHKVTTVKL